MAFVLPSLLSTLSLSAPLVNNSFLVQAFENSHAVKLAFNPPPPPDRGAPGHRRGTAGRELTSTPPGRGAPRGYSPLTALAPVYKTLEREKSVWGLTVSSHPTFWFYIPRSDIPQPLSMFWLQDENDLAIYKTTFKTTETEQNSVVSLSLPSTVTPLKIGKRYHWIFVVQGIFVDGWIERSALKPKLVSQLKVATPREQIALYAANGIWYEALTTLAELRRTKPKDPTIEADWANLLQAIDLNDISSKPIVQCCKPKV